MSNNSLTALCERLNVQFHDPELPQMALTHRSYTHESRQAVENNERLEFLGDALLSAIVADLLMTEYPHLREGALTRMRAALVRGETLTELARACDLGAHLRIGRGEEANGGRKRESILAGAFEAFIGALYWDQGMDTLRGFLIPLLRPRLPAALREAQAKDARSRLQEWAQAECGITPQYETIAHAGPNHAAEFVVEVRLAESESAQGRGPNKQTAAQRAARSLLVQIAPRLAPE